MDGYMQTMKLRFVMREETSRFSADGHPLSHDIVRFFERRVLQQLWVSPFAGEPPQWRDVPMEDEE